MKKDSNFSAGLACWTVIVGFFVVLILMLTRTVSSSPELQIVLGVLAAMAGNALNYFIGSTASSKAKDKAIADVATGVKPNE